MSDGAPGDDAYQPTGTNEEQQDAAPLDMENALEEDDYDTMLDRGYSPPERPYAVNKPGTTAAEQREGESLDERLDEEEPDVGGQPGEGGEDPEADAGTAGDRRSGRLVAPGQGMERPARDGVAAVDVGVDDASASAEEAAVHQVDDPGPGDRPGSGDEGAA